MQAAQYGGAALLCPLVSLHVLGCWHQQVHSQHQEEETREDGPLCGGDWTGERKLARIPGEGEELVPGRHLGPWLGPAGQWVGQRGGAEPEVGHRRGVGFLPGSPNTPECAPGPPGKGPGLLGLELLSLHDHFGPGRCSPHGPESVGSGLPSCRPRSAQVEENPEHTLGGRKSRAGALSAPKYLPKLH